MLDGFYGFVYITTNNVNGKMYIGQRCYHKKGWENYLGSGVYLKRAIRKYGKENFTKTIIKNYINKEELDAGEIYFIQKYDAVNNDNFYNIAQGGDGGNTIKGYTSDERTMLSEKLSKIRKGKVNLGENNGKATKVILLNTMEIFNTMREAADKYGLIPETIGECCRGRTKTSGCNDDGDRLVWRYYTDGEKYEYIPYRRDYSSIKKPVICITSGLKFDSSADAGRYYGISASHISRCCNNKEKSAGKDKTTGEKLVWKYLNLEC